MRIEQIPLSAITFQKTAYPPALKASLLRAGLNFPIHVSMRENGCVCVDGHKRLSAIEDILAEDKDNPKFQTISILVIEHARTAPPYTLHNHH